MSRSAVVQMKELPEGDATYELRWLGARLADSEGRERWPGGVGRLALSDYDDLALPIDPVSLVVCCMT